VPDSPLAAAALVVLCFALPFGVAALFDAGPEPTPLAVQTPAVERIDQGSGTIPPTRLARAPGLPALPEDPEEPVPATPPVTTTPSAPGPSAAPAPASGGDRSTRGTPGGDGSGGSGTSESFDSTG
jgi:hypothetical protein